MSAILTAILIVSLSILAASSVVAMIGAIRERNRKVEFKDWEVGDSIVLIDNKTEYFTLVGWTTESIYIKDDNVTTKIRWDKFDYNKSAIWRRNYDDAKKAMGKVPGFSRGIKDKSISNNSIDGKSIELLTETECQVYLKQCIETEEYEKAELIRERLKNFR